MTDELHIPADEAADPDAEFRKQWEMETMPACNEGMVLLRSFAERYPSLFQIASRNRFIDPVHPAVVGNAMWKAFAAHCSACLKCNEV